MKVVRQKHDNHFCGPAALSAISGKPVDQCTRVLRHATGRRAIFGVAVRDMLAALPMLGSVAAPVPMGIASALFGLPTRIRYKTLAAVLHQLQNRGPEDVYLIHVTKHYLVLKGRKLYDNHNPEGIFVRQYQHRRVRVRGLFAVLRIQ